MLPALHQYGKKKALSASRKAASGATAIHQSGRSLVHRSRSIPPWRSFLPSRAPHRTVKYPGTRAQGAHRHCARTVSTNPCSTSGARILNKTAPKHYKPGRFQECRLSLAVIGSTIHEHPNGIIRLTGKTHDYSFSYILEHSRTGHSRLKLPQFLLRIAHWRDRAPEPCSNKYILLSKAL